MGKLNVNTEEQISISHVAFDILHTIGGKIPPVKVQKLCYYAQALHLARYEKPLFPEDFEKWPNGPICRELFAMHRGEFAISSKDIWSSELPRKFTEAELGTIEVVLCCYGPMDPDDISMLVHKASPYKLTEEGEIIPKELIREYYRIHDPMEPNIWSEED